MPTDLSYGYSKPADGDAGNTWADTLEAVLDRLATHDHDGDDSRRIRVVRQSIASGSYTDLGGGTYRKEITMPASLITTTDPIGDGVTFDDVSIEIRVSSTDEVVYPTLLQASSTSFYLYTNTPNETYVAIYSS